ncbi:MAG: hypothetical protein V1806_14835 [Pseudomonadota bacterium]
MRPTPRPRRSRPWPLLGLVLALALAWTLAACGGTALDQTQPPPAMEQPIVLRLLDQKDRPVAGARLTVTPLQGRPRDPGPYVSDGRGLIQLPWITNNVNQRQGQETRDQVWALKSQLEYLIEAPGFLPTPGSLATEGHYRQLARPELKGIDIPAALSSRVLTVVLHRLDDLLGPGLDQRPTDDPLARRCLDFYEKNRLVAISLGSQFSWPSFIMQGDLLRVRLDWKGAAWSALAKTPLPAQVSLSAGLPLAMLLGEDLLPAPGVARVSLEILRDISPQEGDPYAAPVRARVALTAPAQALADLAAGRLVPDEFLQKYPPTLVEEGPLAVTPFGETR